MTNTLIYMIKQALPNVIVSDRPLKKIENNIQTQKLLFVKYETDTKIKVIDCEAYESYGQENNLIIDNIKGKYINYANKKYKVLSYKDGVIELSEKIVGLYAYNDILELTDEISISNKEEKDFIFVYSGYNYSNTRNYVYVDYFFRYNIDIFVYNDEDNSRITYYSKVLGKLFNRDFFKLDNTGKPTNEMLYVQNQLTFGLTEYNISNKIIRGSMLLKYTSKE